MNATMSISPIAEELARAHPAETLRAALVRRLELDVSSRLDEIRRLQTPQPPQRQSSPVKTRRRCFPQEEQVEQIAAVIREFGQPMIMKEIMKRLPHLSSNSVQNLLCRHFRRVDRGVYDLPDPNFPNRTLAASLQEARNGRTDKNRH